jgi:RNA polymerase sigma factor (sigma-70 family)
MEGVANLAVCMAAFTFDPARSKPTTYFGSAIRHALYRAVLQQQRHDGRYVTVEQIVEPSPNRHRTRSEQRALRALRVLGAYDRTLLEDRLIEQVTLEQLASEQRCDPRTVSKRVKRAIEKLRIAEGDLP